MSGRPASNTGKFKPPPNPKPGQTPVAKRPPSKPSAAKQPVQQEDDASWRAEIRRDPFVQCDLVYGLNDSTLTQFLSDKDVAMVLFYDPCDSMSRWCKPRFAKAAAITTRDNHAYAAVNCLDNDELCVRQDINMLPAYGLYSRGRLIAATSDVSDYTSENIKNFLERAPVFEETVSTKAPCQQGGS
ncbi:hypothetical protein BsWGS_11195 [Bradybaena similaris]